MAAWTKEGKWAATQLQDEGLLLLTPQRHLAQKHEGPCGDCRGDSGGLRISPDESVDDEGEIHLLLSKGLQESPWKVTEWYSKGMLTQPKFPEEITIGHHAYWEFCHLHPSQGHEQALWPFPPPFCSQHGETGRREEFDRVSSMLPSNKEPYIHPEKSFFLLSTKVIRGLSLLPKLLTKISQQCVSLAFLNPIDDNKVS